MKKQEKKWKVESYNKFRQVLSLRFLGASLIHLPQSQIKKLQIPQSVSGL